MTGVSPVSATGVPHPHAPTLADGTVVPTPEDQLPVLLPEDVVMDGVQSPHQGRPQWAKTTYNGQEAFRGLTLLTPSCRSSWCYARFAAPRTATRACWIRRPPTALAAGGSGIGGIEHACMHLLYARFFHSCCAIAGLVNSDEPFKRLLCQGMVLADAFYCKDEKGGNVWSAPTDVKVERDDKGPHRKAVDNDGRG